MEVENLQQILCKHNYFKINPVNFFVAQNTVISNQVFIVSDAHNRYNINTQLGINNMLIIFMSLNQQYLVTSKGMLEVSNNEILFNYNPTVSLVSSVDIKNSSSSEHLYFKIKTTVHQLFQVNPSIGSLGPSQSKTILFRTNRVLSKQEAKDLADRQKFLIQSFPFKSQNKTQIKTLIDKYKKQNPSKIQNIRLVIRVEGLGSDKNKPSMMTPSSHAINFESMAPSIIQNPMDVKPTPELNRKLQELQRQQQRLMKQKQDAFYNATKGLQGKSNSITLGKIMLFVILMFVGFAANKIIRRHRIKLQQPKVAHQVVNSDVHADDGQVLAVDQAKVVYIPESKQYKVQIKPHKRGVEKDYSIKIGPDGIPRITQL